MSPTRAPQLPGFGPYAEGQEIGKAPPEAPALPASQAHGFQRLGRGDCKGV